MSAIVINTENIGKKYRIVSRTGRRHDTLREMIGTKINNWGRSLFHPFHPNVYANGHEEFWALRDVSLEVQQGEVMGIVGRNGAGKTTLLKVLSRITEPTVGTAVIKGRVASLLEVGTGFHPELTGRENTFLNGAILGMTKYEIRKKFDEIVAFAEVEKFIDTPVKHYSSGMYVRLAFAVAAHLNSEILMVDEVLAVGDAEFQKKCLGKMKTVSEGGRTVLFVSHNLGAVSRLCTKAILLDEGRIETIDNPANTIRTYLSRAENKKLKGGFRGPLQSSLRFGSIKLSSDGQQESQLFSPCSAIQLTVTGECLAPIRAYRTSFSLFRDGVRLFTLHDLGEPEDLLPGCFESTFEIPPFLLRPGEYSVSVGGGREGKGAWVWGNNLLHFTIIEEWHPEYQPGSLGLINLRVPSKRRLIDRE
jgi:homopolymeric O-antigen transport system ATP-binding protein